MGSEHHTMTYQISGLDMLIIDQRVCLSDTAPLSMPRAQPFVLRMSIVKVIKSLFA